MYKGLYWKFCLFFCRLLDGILYTTWFINHPTYQKTRRKKMKTNVKVVIVNAIVAALYVMITLMPGISAISFGAFQFRIAEMLNHLIVFDKKYSYGIIGGVLLANTVFMSASGLGMYDLIFGLGHTVVSIGLSLLVFKYCKTAVQKMLVVAGVFSIMIFLVAIELQLALELPFWMSYFQVFVGELGVLLVGIPVMTALNKTLKLGERF